MVKVSKKGTEEIKGRNASGRAWKGERARQSQSTIVKHLKTSYEEKMEQKRRHKEMKDIEKSLKEREERAIEDKKRRRAENIRRRAENEKKGEVYQVISNPNKIKRLTKKQMKNIRIMKDTSSLEKK